ncbi:hypothetical protein MANI_011186 [Metarhizium anisopliae]
MTDKNITGLQAGDDGISMPVNSLNVSPRNFSKLPSPNPMPILRSERNPDLISDLTGNMRPQQHSLDYENASRLASSNEATTAVGSNRSVADNSNANATILDDKIMKDGSAVQAGMEADFQVQKSPFAFTPGQLNKMFNPKSLPAFLALGGILGVEKGMRSERVSVLTADDPEEATATEDMSAASSVATVGVEEMFQDRSRVFKDNQLPRKKKYRFVKATRSRQTAEISVHGILVGDAIHIEPGDLVPVDGILMEGHVKCNESQAPGEREVVRNQPAKDAYVAIENHENVTKLDPCIQSGAQGVGTFITTPTGVYSSYDRTIMSPNKGLEPIPPQGKINAVATYITMIAASASLLLLIFLLIPFLFNRPRLTFGDPLFSNISIIVIAIVIVAVLDGLFLAAALASEFATTRLRVKNNFVRHLKACEAMGNVTTIGPDKTGILRQSKMPVVSGTTGTTHRLSTAQQSFRASGDYEGMSLDDGRGVSSTNFVSMSSAPAKDRLIKSATLNSMESKMVRTLARDKITAQDCGILQPSSVVIQGPNFRNLGIPQQSKIISKLHVLQRSSPEDKRILIERLKEMGTTIAVKAPARKSGTEVAQEASPIVIMDDNFATIVKALKWGQAVNDTVRQFLRPQLTANVPAVLLALILAVSSGSQPSTWMAALFLWVNLIMDTLAALALSTNPPRESTRIRKPESKGSYAQCCHNNEVGGDSHTLDTSVRHNAATLLRRRNGILPIPGRTMFLRTVGSTPLSFTPVCGCSSFCPWK